MNNFFLRSISFVFVVAQLSLGLRAQDNKKQIDSLQNLLDVEKNDTTKLSLVSQIMAFVTDPEVYNGYNEQVIKICARNINTSDITQRDFYLLHYAEGLAGRGYYYQNRGENKEVLKCYESAKKMLEKIKVKTPEARSAESYVYHNISAVYRELGRSKEALKYLEESLKLFLELNDKIGLASAYNNLGSYYSSVAQMTLALEYLNKGLDVYIELKDKEGMATSYSNIGGLHDKLGNEKEVIANYQKAYDLIRQTSDKRGEAIILQNIGISYGEAGNVKIGLEYLQRALIAMEELKEKKGIYSVLMNIGGIYYRDGDYKLSEEYTLKCLKIAKEIDYAGGIATCYLRLGNANGHKKEYKKADEYFRMAYQLSEADNQERAVVDVLNSMAAFQFKRGEVDSALYNYNKSLKMADKLQFKLGKSNAIKGLSQIYFDRGDLKQAKKLSEEAFKYWIELGQAVELRDASNLLYKIYKKTGEDTKALEMHELYVKMDDSLKTEETQRAIIQSQLRNEYNDLKTKDSLAYLAKDKKNSQTISGKDEQLRRSEMLKYILMFASAILFVIIFIVYRNYNRKSAANRIIEKQNRDLEAKNKEKELLMHEIHHRVKNNLQIVSGLLKMPQKNIQDTGALEVMDESRQRIHSISLIHKLLYEKNDLTHINAREYVNELCNEVLKSFSLPEQKIDLKLEVNDVRMEVDQFLPLALILNELLLNSIKYAFKKVESPEIKVSLQQKNDEILFNFSDNGKEDASDLIKAKNSFGTKMIFSLTSQLNGLINVYFKEGTNISINFKAV